MMTHDELPWIAARERSGARPLERSTEELHDDEIFEFFDELATIEVIRDEEAED